MNLKKSKFLKVDDSILSHLNYLIISIVSILLGAFIYLLNENFSSTKRELHDSVEQRIQLSIKTGSDRLSIKNINLSTFAFDDSDIDFPTYVFQDEALIFWYSGSWNIEPELRDLYKKVSFIADEHNTYISFTVEEGRLKKVGLLPLFFDSPLNNRYLKDRYNKDIFDNYKPIINENQVGYPVSVEGQVLFWLDWQEVDINNSIYPLTSFILFLVGLVFLILWLTSLMNRLFKNLLVNTVIYFSTLLAIRLLLRLFNFPDSICQLTLFDSRIYTSGWLNNSLGDLLISIILLFILVVNFYTQSSTRLRLTTKGFKNVSIFFSLCLFALLAYYFQHSVILNILTNSQISLDISSELYSDYKQYISLIIIFLSGSIFFLINHVIVSAFINTRTNIWIKILGVILALLIFFILDFPYKYPIAAFFILYNLTLFISKLPKYLNKINYASYGYLFLTSLAISVIASFTIYKNYERIVINQKEKFANQLVIEEDVIAEFLLSDAINNITNDQYIKSRLYSPSLVNEDALKSKIKRNYLPPYFTNYNLNVHLFADSGNTISSSLQKFDNLSGIKSSLKSTDFDNIYKTNYKDISGPSRLVALSEIVNYGDTLGYIGIELIENRYADVTLYPLLITERETKRYFEEYGYALYKDGDLKYKSGSYFEYPLDFQQKKIYQGGVEEAGHHFYAEKADQKGIFVISSPLYERFNILTNASFFFSTFFIGYLFVGLLRLFSRITRVPINLSAKIQIFLALAFFLPLLMVSIAVLRNINQSNKEEIQRNYQKRLNNLGESITDVLEAFNRDLINRETLQYRLSNMAEYSRTDLNLFNYSGQLLASSQPYLYDNNILPGLMNAQALQAIKYRDIESLVIEEKIGELSFKSAYLSIKSYDTNELLGVMNLPFVQSKNYLQRQSIQVFKNLVNIFALILVLLFLVSYTGSKVLTRPLIDIARHLGQTDLSKKNIPIRYDTKDEIGLLVQEYNNLIEKLEESKIALARSEKESAWKEIARQVAHEIKNPLTPMKLSLQHLLRIVTPSGKEYQTINSLLKQIDNLDQIVSSFSEFAKMPIPESYLFDVNNELKNAVELFRNDKGRIKAALEDGNFMVKGDKKLMARIFNNLLINAYQSIPDNKTPLVEVFLKSMSNNVFIEIRDNGTGIEESIQSKVFMPNFSTKSTGSGLGLAIAKRGVEHAGGEIWFESELNKGTSFYISLPLHS